MELPETLPPQPLRLGEKAPDFTARSTRGVVSLSDFRGRWLALFSHPADFTPVCTSEFVAIARAQGCAAIHPGYGFLAENAEFARLCQAAGLTFIGPAPEVLELFGDKAAARALAERCGAPLVAGLNQAVSLEQARAFQAEHGAVMLKALAGGGGRGMRAIHAAAELDEAYARCQSEAQHAFGNGALYIEQLVRGARHIEVMCAIDIGLAVVACFLAGDIGLACLAFVGIRRVVVGRAKRFRHRMHVRLNIEYRLNTRFQTGCFPIGNPQFRLVNIVIDVVADLKHIAKDSAMRTRQEIAVQPLLFHKQPDVVPVGHLVLEPEWVLRILATNLERELVAFQAVAAKNGFDNLWRGLSLIDTACLGQRQQGDLRAQLHFIGAEVAGLTGF